MHHEPQLVRRAQSNHPRKGAILAQIAITALSLPYLESTHWTAEGAFVISLIAGLLSVYYACMVQQQLGDLQTPDEALRWMTTTRIYDSDGRYTILRKDAPIITPLPMNRRILPSYSSALLLVVPSQLLNWSSSSLLIGIGVYYGLLYTKHLGELRGDNANLAILLVYVLFTSGAVASYFWPWWRQRLEAADAAKGKYHRRQRGWSRHRHSGEWYAYGAASPSTGGASVASMQPAPPQNRVPPATSESAHDASLQIHTEPALDVNGHGSSDNAGSDGGGADIHQPRDDSPEEPEAEGTPPKPTRSQGRYNRADQAIIDALEASITAQKASCRAQETLLQTYLK